MPPPTRGTPAAWVGTGAGHELHGGVGPFVRTGLSPASPLRRVLVLGKRASSWPAC